MSLVKNLRFMNIHYENGFTKITKLLSFFTFTMSKQSCALVKISRMLTKKRLKIGQKWCILTKNSGVLVESCVYCNF